tara:strand:+ start:347 stop:511 length:165 start_codon:yes stop_codon:yes gene_type:complete
VQLDEQRRQGRAAPRQASEVREREFMVSHLFFDFDGFYKPHNNSVTYPNMLKVH